MSPSVRAPDRRYWDPEGETLSPDDLRSRQTARLLDLLPRYYAHSDLIRSQWDDARVHPREIRSLEDFRERAPFMSKATIREVRDRSGDPFGGNRSIPVESIDTVYSGSGTTGDIVLYAENQHLAASSWGREFWEIGSRPGDIIALAAWTFRGPMLPRVQLMGATPAVFNHSPDDLSRFCRISLELRPTSMYLLSNPLILSLTRVAERERIDLADIFGSYRGAIVGGEPIGRRGRAQLAEWGLELFLHSGVGDVVPATECREHNGCHFNEEAVLCEVLAPGTNQPVAAGEIGEIVSTSLTGTLPLVRYRSDDLARVDRTPCACGRTNARITPMARIGDEVVVSGQHVFPILLWDAIESVPETSDGLFQLIRPQREVDSLRIRVGYASGGRAPSDIGIAVADAVHGATGVVPEVLLVPNEVLAASGPSHKIARVVTQ